VRWRACEIPQLEGAALRSCVEDLACSDCTPGFCATRVPELLDNCPYPEEPVPWPLRLPQLPGAHDGFFLEATCNFEQ